MIVTMVHGTWARDAAWTKVTSALSIFLQAKFDPIRITPLEWSGGNSHAARMEGAIKLRQHILKWKNDSPRERQIIIAHSHGGNVAMYALRDEEAAAAVRGVVCLSTPYLFCRSRDLGTRGVRSVIRFFFWCIVAILSLPIFLFFPSSNIWAANRIIGAILGAIVVAIAGAIVGGFGHIVSSLIKHRFRLPDDGDIIENVYDSFAYPESGTVKTLSIRAPGDEATTALTTAHAFSAIFTRLYRVFDFFSGITDAFENIISEGFFSRLLASLVFFFPAILLGVFAAWLGSAWENTSACLLIVACLLGIIGMFLVATPGIANWLVMFCAISFGFCPFVLLSLLCILTCSFGKDTGLIASFLEITCESTPPGNANVHILTNQQKHDLWHSVPYQSPAAFTTIENWINSIVIRKSATSVAH